MDDPTRSSTASPPARRLASRAVRAWYLATPLLALLDFGFGVNVRATFLDAPVARLLYYGIAFGCGLAALRWPSRTALVGLVESGSNIAWLVIGVGLRYLAALDAMLSDDVASAVPFDRTEVLNLVLSAAVLAVSYVAALARVDSGRWRAGSPS